MQVEHQASSTELRGMREFKLRTSQRPRPLPSGRWTMTQRWNDIHCAELRLNQRTEREFSFYSRRMFVNTPVIFSARYRGLGPTRRLAEIKSGTLEYFFTERYCMFRRNHAGQPVRANIHAVASPLE